jgi:PIN domain nuclease of toxin-antitoxin system
MRLLLDTHIFLWVVIDDPRLSTKGRELIIEAEAVFISSASIWEASIKVGLGKLQLDIDALIAEIGAGGYLELPVRATHAARVRTLPPVHRDPFDRLLVAQALTEPLFLLTDDQILAQYSDLVITL